jgi:hypothetical protein
MENVFEKLLKTYNTNYLDSLHIDLQEALKRESEEKQLSSGSKREILRQLIENHYDESKNKPTAQFIGGPFSLTVHWIPEYKKYIYIYLVNDMMTLSTVISLNNLTHIIS